MPSKLVGMIDAGFLRETGAHMLKVKLEDLSINPSEIVNWLHICAERMNAVYLRSYWYDAAYKYGTPQHAEQRKLFDSVEDTPGMQIRLGNLIERPKAWEGRVRDVAKEYGLDPREFVSKLNIGKQYEQKGVDTLIVMDLVRLAQQGTYDYVILLAGDRDLAEAIRTAQDFGRLVLVAAPQGTRLSPEIGRLSDEVLWLTEPVLKPMLVSASS